LPLGTDVHPLKLFSSQYIEAYYKKDHEFSLPKAEINIRLYFSGQNSAKEEVVRSIFEKMLA
jgi:hypothetical protein